MKTRPSAPVRLTLTVKEFRNVLTTKKSFRGTLYTMSLDEPHPLVEMQDTPDAQPHLTIGEGRVKLCIRIQSSPKDKRHYMPVGISFSRKRVKGKHAGKRLYEPEIHPPHEVCMDEKERTVSAVADFSAPGEGDHGRYKFSVMIQCEETGALGIIDPDTIHDPVEH